MNKTTLTPEPSDDDLNKLRESITRTLDALALHLPILQSRDPGEQAMLLSRLVLQLIIEETSRQQCVVPQTLISSWSQRLTHYAQEKLATSALSAPHATVSYTPIPLGTNEQGEMVELEYTNRTSGVYVSGNAGQGKSSLMENIVVGDIENGHGVTVIDPHGELIEHIIRRVPIERIPDVILWKPGTQPFSFGLNVLEHTPSGLEVDITRATELMDRLYGFSSPHPAWGYRSDTLYKMSLHVLYANSLTLVELPHLLSDQDLRKRLMKILSHEGPDHYVRMFWNAIESLRKDERQKIFSPLENKIYAITRSREMLNIISQMKTTLPMRKIMDERKIFLVHADKSSLGGDENIRLIMTVLFGEVMRAAFSRKAGDPNNPMHTLCVDEFQNFVSSEFQDALPEVRKFGLAVVLGNQFYQQLGTLRAAIEQLSCQGTFRSIIDDAELRAPFYQEEPETLYREQFKRYVPLKPATFVVNGTHAYTNKRVIEFFKIRQLFSGQGGYKKPTSDLLRETFSDLFDSHYHESMTANQGKGNPFLPPPFFLFPEFNLVLHQERPDLFGEEEYSPKNKHAFLYWHFIRKQVEAAEQDKLPKTVVAAIDIERPTPEEWQVIRAKAQEYIREMNAQHETTFTSQTQEELGEAFVRIVLQGREKLLREKLELNETIKSTLKRVLTQWDDLFTAQTEAELQEALTQWNLAARKAIQDEMLCNAETLLHENFTLQVSFDWMTKNTEFGLLKRDNPIIGSGRPVQEQEEDVSQRTNPDYVREKREAFEEKWKGVNPDTLEERLGFPCDIQTLRSLLTFERMQWKGDYSSRYLPDRDIAHPNPTGKGTYMQVHASDTWTPVEGLEELFLPFIAPVVEEAVREAAPVFEAHIRFLRDIQQALVALPITVTSSETEQVAYGKKSTNEMRNEMAAKLVNLEEYHCYVRLGVGQTTQKPCIHTLKPDEGVSLEELEERSRLLNEQTKQYGTDPAIIEQELKARRARLGIGSPLDLLRTDTPAPQMKPTEPDKTDGKVKQPGGTGQKDKTTPVPSSTPTALVFDDNYPFLLFHWFHLSLSQIKKLLGKKPTDTHIAERMKKFIADGLIKETEWKVPGKRGKPEKIYSLTDTGIRFVETSIGVKSGSRNMSVTQHNLLVSDALIALSILPASVKEVTLTSMQHELYFKSHGIKLPGGKGLEPDGLVQYRVKSGETLSIYCEVDRGFEGRSVWKDKCSKYVLALILGLLAPRPLKIAVINSDQSMRDLLTWTEELLTGHEEYASLFAFTDKDFLTIPPKEFFTGMQWVQPFDPKPVSLLSL